MFKQSTGDASDARRQDSPGLLRAKQLEWIVSFSVLLSEKASDAPDAHLRALMKDWSRALDDLASRQYLMGIERIPIAEGGDDSARGYPAALGPAVAACSPNPAWLPGRHWSHRPCCTAFRFLGRPTRRQPPTCDEVSGLSQRRLIRACRRGSSPMKLHRHPGRSPR